MNKHPKIRMIATSSLMMAVLLSGCQYSQWESLLPNNKQEQASPSPQPLPPSSTNGGTPTSGSSTSGSPAAVSSTNETSYSPYGPTQMPIDLTIIPKVLVLPPGESRALPQAKGMDYKVSSPLVSIKGGEVVVSRQAQDGDHATVTVSYQGQTKEVLITVMTPLADTVKTVNGVPTVTNPNDLLVVVNKQRSLPEGFVPKDLVEPNVPFSFSGKSEKRLLRKEAAKALEEMFAQAKQENIQLFGVSGYRSYTTQKDLFASYVKTQGSKHAFQYSAQAGKSEHQTGLAIDVSGPDSNTRLEESFVNTPEGKWLAKHAADFGFIIRYPKGKESITGYSYEPWHIRYVGKEVAQEIARKNITLEQYFQQAESASRNFIYKQ